MRAVLMAGGKGTRLYPYTAVLPKPLVPLGDRPILEILIRRLKEHGFDHITLCVGHLASLIEAYFKDGQWLGVKIDYSFEHEPLGTVGPLTLVEDLPDTFLVANGDLLTDIDFSAMMEFHKKKKALLTVGTYKRMEKIELGILEIEGDQIKRYLEKPTKEFYISSGLYIFDKKVLDLLVKGERNDFPNLVTSLIDQDKKVVPFEIEGFWLDIGRPDDYQKAVEIYTTKPETFTNK